MTASDMISGKSPLIARIFELINRISEDRVLIILKELLKEKFSDHIFKEMESTLGGMWAVETDPGKMAALIIDHINKKRKKLGIEKGKERVLYDMEMRRELEI